MTLIDLLDDPWIRLAMLGIRINNFKYKDKKERNKANEKTLDLVRRIKELGF